MRSKLAAVVLTVALLAVFVLGPAALAAQGPQRVVILPFTANAKEDISFIVKGVRDMLATRLAWQDKVTVVEPDLVATVMKKIPGPYTDAKARSIGKELSAQAVVFGSITVLGKAVSVDAQVVRTDGTGQPLNAYVQASDLDQIIPRINDFAMRINAEMFKRPEAVAAQKSKGSDTMERYLGKDVAKQQEQAQQKSGTEGDLEKLPKNISPLNPLFMRALSGIESDRYWRSPRIKGAIRSVAVADIDLDDKNEILVLMEKSIKVFRLSKKHFAQVYELKNLPKGKKMFIDAADIDGDGRAEIYVSNLNNDSIQSFVLQWQPGGGLAIVVKDQDWWFRIQQNPIDGRPVLFGQEKTMDQAFAGPVYKLHWSGGNLEPGDEVPLPKLGNIFNFTHADLNGGGAMQTIVVMPNYDLQVYSPRMEPIFQSSGEVWCASDKFIKKPPGSELGHTSEEDIWEFVPTRIVVHDLDQDKRQNLVVVRNKDRFGEFMDKMRIYYQGTIFSLYWNGMNLAEDWRTPRIGGYVVDYGLADVGNIGKPALYMAVSQKQSKDYYTIHSGHIIAFTLKIDKKLKRTHMRQEKGLR